MDILHLAAPCRNVPVTSTLDRMLPSHCTNRYGHSDDVSEANFAEVVDRLLAELRFEHDETPDDEHTQVSISTEHWSVSVDVSGLVIFDNIDLLEGEPTDLPEAMFLRDLPDESVKELWKAVAENNRAALLSFRWRAQEELEPYVRDFYRRAV